MATTTAASTSLNDNDIVNRTRELLDERQAAEYLTLSAGTLSVWRSTGRYEIPFVKIGSRVRYKRAELEKWIESRTRSTGATE